MPLRNAKHLLVYVSGIIFLQACQTTPSEIPFPEHETEFSQPVSMPYKFGEPKKIKWESPNPDSIKPVTETKLDFNKLPFKPFDIGDFRPLLKPMDEIKFDLNSLPDTVFDFDKLPTQKITFKVSILGQPIRTKATKPHIHDKATKSIFEYGLDQGLSSGGAIPSLLQDSRSFLWICTANGLYRYDGENFDLYTATQGLTSFSLISSLSEDHKGQIWTFSPVSIDIIDLNDGVLKHLVTSPEFLVDIDIFSSLVDSEGKIWLSTNKGIYIIDQESKTLKHFTVDQGLIKNDIHNLLEDDLGNIWLGAKGAIDIVNTDKKTLKHISNLGRFFNRFTKDDKGRILVRTSDGSVNIIDLKKGTLKQLGTSQGIRSDTIFSVLPDKNGKLWVSTAVGIDIVNTNTEEIKHLNAAEGKGQLFKDNQGHLWINDGYAQVEVIDLNGGMFTKLSTQPGSNSNAIFGLFEDSQGRIWIDGGDILDLKAGTIKHIDSSQGLKLIPQGFFEDHEGQIWIYGGNDGAYIYNQKAGTLKHLTAANGLKSDTLFGIYKDKMDNIWLYCNGGFSVYNSRDKTFKNLNLSVGVFNGVWSCMEDDQGNMWVLTIGHGLDVIDLKKETIKHFITGKRENFSPLMQMLVKDENGKILMSSNGYGLYVIDPTKGTFINFTTKEGLINNEVQSLTEKHGIIYASTNEGLTVIKPINDSRKRTVWQVKSYGKPQLISHVDFNSNSVLSTTKDQIWWGVGADGILIMDEPKEDNIIPPTYITGIDVMELPQLFANIKLFKNNVGATDTIWSINRDKFYVNGKMPVDSGYLETNHIGWDSVTGPWNMPVKLQLPYDQNFIRFHFTGTHLGNPEKTRYRYILEGNDRSWSAINDKPFTDDYRNLLPGKYTFKVCSRGFNGLWSRPVELSFTITPPWWKTWWAYFLYTALFILGLVEFIRWRTNKVKKENLRLEGKIMQRTKELKHSLEDLRETQAQLIHKEKMASLGELTAGIAHEIQNPLNFVNNFSEVSNELLDEMKTEIINNNQTDAMALADNVKANLEKILQHGKKADGIVKSMLQHSRGSSGVKELTDLNALTDEYLKLAYHGLRAKDKSFNSIIQTDYDASIGNISIIPQEISRAILNLITNAFYAVNEKKKQEPENYEPTVWVSTKKDMNQVSISVKDNGNGIPKNILDKIFQPFFTTKPSGDGTGLGLSLSYDIVKAHNGELKVFTKENEGSEFIIELPIK